MLGTGFLGGLIAKLVGLGTAAKVAIATTTAALSMAVAGTAVGVLPIGGSPSEPATVEGTSHLAGGVVQSPTDSVPPTTTAAAGAQAGGEVAAQSSTASTSARAGADVAGSTSPAPTVPEVPALPGLDDLPDLPACVTNIVSTALTTFDPMAVLEQVPACIQTVLRSIDLPVDVSKCLAAVMSSLSGFAAGDLSGLPQLVAACLPTGMSTPGTGSIPGMGSIPGFPPGR